MFLKTVNLFKTIIFILIIGIFFSFADPASAQIGGLTDKPLSEIITGAINWLLGVAASLTILFVIIGGIYYISAAGDDQQMETAKKIITYAIIGLVFIVISYSIVLTVNSIITG